ncbi:uncharacterized protein LOC117169304 isoform X2 [Belonocnema kinseyi]|uniref:uncharacterized protein LOC117169304 isoform X2 n=1 Tax=Belonocnema kinseyi TaxID=2817044 RepID=UPI00143D4A90|nr:uncharacterized protein LOC117169304 isoform X2 [Belonocnema kinseyi]
MYTLTCLQVAYEFLNREWMFLIYGEQKETWYKYLNNWIKRWYLNILNSINFKIDYRFPTQKNYRFLTIVIIMSLGAFFAAYKIIKKLQSLEVVKKYVMEFQWWRNENSNEMSPAFHENNNESAELKEDFTLGTSLTAIVKPTIRTSETWETVKAKDDERNYGNENISLRLTPSQNSLTLSMAEDDSDSIRIRGKVISTMRKIFEKNSQNDVKPLVKCSSSLYVVTSKDSLNTELRTEYITENSKSQLKGNQKKRMKMADKTNNNLTFAVHESSSVFEVDDVISSVFEDTMSHYQCSPTHHRNSSCVSGHFVERLPDLDLSPIQNLSPKNRSPNQSLKKELYDKEVQEAESKDTGQGSSDQRYFSKSLSSSPRRSEKSFEKFVPCVDYKIGSFGEKTINRMHSKIPRRNSSSEEEATSLTKSEALEIAGSKIPVPLRKCQINNSAEIKLHDTPRKYSIRTDYKKETKRVNYFGSKESEQSLEKFLQLEIATGCLDPLSKI